MSSSITINADMVMPESVLLANVTGTRMRQNTRTINIGGYANVNVDRDTTLRRYQIATQPLLKQLASAVIGIYESTDAGGSGFLISDPVDSSVSPTEGAFQGYAAGVESGVVGFGNGTPLYGFRKVYAAYGSSMKRAMAVTRLRGAPLMLRGGSPIVVGAAPGNASLSAGPTYITFVADASQNVTAIAVGATTQVTLASAIAGFVVGGQLWLQDLAGAHASLLNNLSHQITNIAGNVYTLATNTAGKTITAAGTGKKYPQPDEALTWSGHYYVPVHFRDDDLEWELLAGGPPSMRMVSFTACYLDEVKEA